ncbi:PXA domain-containing protein [Thermothelomyces heterothallicus CBS 202.75]|uniref:PXA domain-containing protein n=1 Tax=Thermothelomyces heterothallicus CBS 202.75 TaxID=1149848 RepID=UPI003742E562
MTTTAAQPPPARVPTPRPKASRTSSLVSESAPATKSRPSQQPHAPDEGAAKSQQPGLPRRGGRPASADPLSDKATAFLVRRILCPQQADKGKGSPDSIEGLLPPLTSRNDVDLQLYALIAIILREFVQSWYAKITADETFVAEIVHIIAHITRALEQRVRTVDLESLLFDELPDLLDKHVTAYRIAHDPMAQAPVATDPREVYHSLCPLPALSPVPRPEDSNSVAAQAENEAAYRQLLVDAFLAVLLPTEDLQNGCLTALVGQILSELILGNAVADRLSQPWLIWELLIIAARVVGAGAGKGAEQQERSRRRSNTSSDVRTRLRHSVHALFYTCLQWCFFAVTFIRTVFTILMTSGSLPSRVSHGESAKGAAQRGTTHEAADPASPADLHSPRTPVLAFRCWSALSNLAEVDIRMPWLRGAISLLQWIAVMRPGRVAGFDSALDR